MKLEYRRFQKGYEPALSALYQEVFGVDLPPEYWEWKYYQNPAGEHIIYVALEGDKIVGGVGAIPVKVKVGSEEVLALQTCDIVISSRYRKGTPFFRLHRLGTEEQNRRGLGFVYGFSIEATYRISTKMLGFVGAGPIRKLVKIFDPTPFLRNKVKPKLLGNALGAFGAGGLKMIDRLRIRPVQDVEINTVDHFNSAFDELWRTRCDDFEIMVVRDSAYLDWRYSQNPAQAYRTFAAMENGAPAAFAVTCMRQEGEIRRGYVVDLLAPPQDKKAIEALFAHLIDDFCREGVDTVTAWLPEHTTAFRLARRVGFVTCRTPHDLIVRGHGRWENSYLAEKSRWFLTMGDSDNY